jgi:hypothetical protein
MGHRSPGKGGHRRFAERWRALRGKGLTRSDIYCAIRKINFEKEQKYLEGELKPPTFALRLKKWGLKKPEDL